jgi:hypothetical protein
MLECVKGNVDDLLARESHQLCKQKIHNIRAAMEALVYAAEKFSTIKLTQFHMRLNSTQQVATKWSDADHQKTIEQLDREIHQMSSAKHKVFDK